MEKKSVFICPEDCQYFLGEDGCGSGHIDTSSIYEKEGDYPICPFYSKPLMGMTLEKAIEIQEQYSKAPESVSLEDETASIQLGIEAMKRLKELRRMKYVTDFTLLPGESS